MSFVFLLTLWKATKYDKASEKWPSLLKKNIFASFCSKVKRRLNASKKNWKKVAASLEAQSLCAQVQPFFNLKEWEGKKEKDEKDTICVLFTHLNFIRFSWDMSSKVARWRRESDVAAGHRKKTLRDKKSKTDDSS